MSWGLIEQLLAVLIVAAVAVKVVASVWREEGPKRGAQYALAYVGGMALYLIVPAVVIAALIFIVRRFP